MKNIYTAVSTSVIGRPRYFSHGLQLDPVTGSLYSFFIEIRLIDNDKFRRKKKENSAPASYLV